VLFIAMICIPLAGWTVRSALRARDWRDNESLYRSALREDPGALLIRSFLAEELLRQGRFAAADSLVTMPREIRPPRSWLERRSLVLAAMKSLRLQSYEDASRTLEAITESPYSQTSDWFNLGTALVNLRRYADAESALRTGLVREPRNAAGYRMLARIYLETGRDSLAQETLDRSCNLDPLNSIGWYSSALPRMRRAGLAAAIERLAQAERQGISVRELIRADADTWKAMGVEPSLLLDSLDARKR
jgi:predicted Zn-dependent protease